MRKEKESGRKGGNAELSELSELSECGEWRSSEISADLRRKVAEVYESGQGYTTISKALDLNGTTVRAILTKWKKFGTVVNLPRSGRPAKISPQARRIIISEVKKKPSAWSRELQASLASAQVNVQDSTIRKTLCKNGRVVSRKPLFPKRNMAACQECSGNLQNISSLEGRSVPPRIKSPLCSEKCLRPPEGEGLPLLEVQLSDSADL